MNYALVLYTARTNLLNQITQTYLGWIWWILEPVLTMSVYYFVFQYLLNRGGPGYVYVLLVGIAVWTWFGNTVSHASTSILREKAIISRIDINKVVFPAISIVEHAFRNALVFSVLLVFLGFTVGTQISWLYLPVLIIEQCLLVSAVSVMLAALVPFFPDLNFLITIGLRAAMFCSGIFFTVEMLPEDIRSWFLLNPMANLIEQYRQVLIHGGQLDWSTVAVICGFSMLILTGSILFLRKHNRIYARLVIQ